MIKTVNYVIHIGENNELNSAAKEKNKRTKRSRGLLVSGPAYKKTRNLPSALKTSKEKNI